MKTLLSKVEGSLSDLEGLLNKLPEHIERLEKQIKLCDEETQDVLHLLELSNFNASEGWKLSKDLQMTRQARRNAKDELNGLLKIQERFKRNSKMSIHVEASNRDLSNHRVNLAGRNYMPRVRTDLAAQFVRISAKSRGVMPK